MTNSPPNPPPERREPSVLPVTIRWLTRPSTLIFGGITTIVVIAGVVGVQRFASERIPPLVESELTKLLKRPVKIGKVEQVNLNQVRVGRSTIPATETDPNTLSIPSMNITFNPLGFLVGKPITFNAELIDPVLSLKQDKEGKWIKLDFPQRGEKFNLPVDIEANITLKNAQVILQPYALKQAIPLKINGTVGFQNRRQPQQQRVEYDVAIAFNQSQMTAQGHSIIETGESKVALSLKKLSLPEIVALIPNFPATVNQGIGNGTVKVDLPSLQKLDQMQTLGNLNLNNLQAKVDAFKDPLQVNLAIALEGQKVVIQQGQIQLGKLSTGLTGSIDWKKGYSLGIITNDISVKDLFNTFAIKTSLTPKGNIQGKFKVSGALNNPLVAGTIKNSNTLAVDKINIQAFNTDIRANLDKIILQKIQIKPTQGGEVRAVGQVDVNILKFIKENRPIQWQAMPVFLKFKALLPTEKLIKPYYILPENVEVSSIAADGKISGTLAKATTQIKWNTEKPVSVAQIVVSGKGEIVTFNQDILLRNTILKTNKGKLLVDANGNFGRNQWQGNIKANQFILTPFIRSFCEQKIIQNCPTAFKTRPLIVTNANLNLRGQFDRFEPERWQGAGNIAIQGKTESVALKGNLNQGNVQADLTAKNLPLNPYVAQLTVPVIVQKTQVNLTGSLKNLLADSGINLRGFQGVADVRLRVANNPVRTRASLNQGFLKTATNLGALNLNRLVPNLPVSSRLVRGKVNLAGNITDYANLKLKTLTGNANLQLAVAGSPLNLRSEISQGQLTAIANIGRISLKKVLPQLTVAAQISQGRINLIADLESVLATKTDLASIQAIADIQGKVDRIEVNTKTNLANNQWQSLIQASSVNKIAALPGLSPEMSRLITSSLAAKLKLSGNIDNLLEPNGSLPIRAESVSVRSGKKQLQAQGTLLLTDVLRQPKLAQVNLALQAEANLNDPLINQIIQKSLVNINEQVRPSAVELAGIANFKGNLNGIQVTSIQDINLLGNLQVNNLVFNDQQFEPRLMGTINVNKGQKFAFNLKGKEDIIAIALDPCINCISPYIPASFSFRQTYQTSTPIIAEGQRQGDRFLLNISQFPLAILNFTPGKLYNIPGNLKGEVNAQLNINVKNLTGKGILQVENLGVGDLVAESLKTEISYQNNFLQLNNTLLQLNNGLYRLSAGLNLKTQEVQARLKVEKGKVYELLAGLRIFDVDSLLRLLQLRPQPTAIAKQIGPVVVGNKSNDLADQVNLLYEIDKKIRALALQYQAGGIPNELKIDGLFDTEITLAGTLNNPTVNLNFQGKNWSWYPQRAFADIVPPLGLVMTDTRFVPIHQVDLQAHLSNGILTVKPSFIQIKNSLFSAEGNFSSKQTSAIWQIENLSLDTISNFVRLPGEFAGDLNAQGSITGTFDKPQLRGEFSFVNGAINARSLDQAIAGNFNYTDARFQIITDQESPLFFYASVPYPIDPTRRKTTDKEDKFDQFEVKVKLQNSALDLLDELTQDQLTWVSGDGEINLSAIGKLDLTNQVRLYDFQAQGEINFNNGVIRSAVLPSPVTLTGKITLNNELIRVEQLVGNFAQGQLLVAGDLPIFRPKNALANPLNLVINKTAIDVNSLYKGDLEGNIWVKGTAFAPVVSGAIKLANGQILLPEEVATEPATFTNPWSKPRQAKSLIIPRLEALQITLENLFVQQTPLYDFSFAGQLSLNGSLDNLSRIQPQGSIILNRGRVSFLDTRFLLERRYNNAIVFKPNQGLFNPSLDIKMRTIVSELPQTSRIRSAESSEIPDDTLNQVARIDINLGLKGSLNQLLPNLSGSNADICGMRNRFRPIRKSANLSERRLKRLTNCLQILASQGAMDTQLLSNPVVRLTSNPPRSQGEIVRLLGEQLLVVADAVQGKNTSQLLQFGITQLAIPMIFQGLVYDVETSISNVVGTTDIRIVPFLEAIYEVDKNAYVRLSYDYSFNEVKVRYERQF
jgi:hypothetical protein